MSTAGIWCSDLTYFIDFIHHGLLCSHV